MNRARPRMKMKTSNARGYGGQQQMQMQKPMMQQNSIQMQQKARMNQHAQRWNKKMRTRVQLDTRFNVAQEQIRDSTIIQRKRQQQLQGIIEEGTDLVEVKVKNVRAASTVFLDEVGDDTIPIVLVPEWSWWHSYTIVPTGVYAVVTHYGRIGGNIPRDENGQHTLRERFGPVNPDGTAVGSSELQDMPAAGDPGELADEESRRIAFDAVPPGCLEAGFHFMGLGWRVSHVITKNHVPFDFPVKMCHTLDHVFVSIDTLIVFHITNPVRFIGTLSPEKLTKLLRSKLEESIRSLARRSFYYEVYDMRGRNLSNMMRILNSKLGSFGVEVTQVNITAIELPEDLQNSMQAITLYESRESLRVMKHEFAAQMARQEMEKLATQQKRGQEMQISAMHQRRGIMLAAKERAEISADAQRVIGRVKATGVHETQRMGLQARLDQTKMIVQKKNLLRRLREEGLKESAILKSREAAYDAQKKSEVNLALAQNRAECLGITSTAEESCSRSLVAFRANELKQKRVEVLDGLASNQQCYILGSNDYSPLAQMAEAVNPAAILASRALDGMQQ